MMANPRVLSRITGFGQTSRHSVAVILRRQLSLQQTVRQTTLTSTFWTTRIYTESILDTSVAMRLVNSILLSAATLLVGCSHAPPLARTQTPAPVFIERLEPHQMFITTNGTTFSPDGLWRVIVSEAGDSLQVSRLDASGVSHAGLRLGGAWKAQPGWFAFIENDSRVWSFDGDRDVNLMIATPGHAECSGPPFSYAVPPPVFFRLSESARRTLKLPDPFTLQ